MNDRAKVMRRLRAAVWTLLAAGIAAAGAADEVRVDVQGVAPGSALEVVLRGANGTKTVPVAAGTANVAADFMNEGKAVSVYVDTCKQTNKVSVTVVEDGAPPPKNENCDRKVIAGLFWRRGGRLVVDAAKGTAVFTPRPAKQASSEGGRHTRRYVGIGLGAAAVVVGGVALAGGGSDGSGASNEPEISPASFNGRWAGPYTRTTAQAAACGLSASAPDGFVNFTAGAGNAATAVSFDRPTSGTFTLAGGTLTYRGSGTGAFLPSGRTFTNELTFIARSDGTGTVEETFRLQGCPEPIVYRADVTRQR